MVEDEHLIREMVKDCLELRGYQVLIAKDGLEGLEKAQAEFRSAKEHFEDCGADLYMPKPFNPFHLVNNVAKTLEQAKGR